MMTKREKDYHDDRNIVIIKMYIKRVEDNIDDITRKLDYIEHRLNYVPKYRLTQ